jgi:hypothetical protein
MLKKALILVVMAALLWLSGCATGSYSSSSTDYGYGPWHPYTHQYLCDSGAIYCGHS